MPSDTQSNVPKRREFSLSFILAGGLFFILTLVAVVIFLVTYQSSDLVVEQQRTLQHKHSNAISHLIIKGRMDGLSHIIDLASEDPNFRSLYKAQKRDDILSYLRSIFYARKQNNIGFVALLSEEGAVEANLHNELFPLKTIIDQIQTSYREPGVWKWAFQGSDLEGPVSTLIYYKREMLDNFTGKVSGYLIGGFFLNDNQELIQEFQTQAEADFSILLWKDNVLAVAGESPKGVVGQKSKFLPAAIKSLDAEFLFYNKVLMSRFLGTSEFSIINGFKKRYEKELQEFYLISVGVAVLMAFLLSVFSALAARTLFLQPLRGLVLFARKAERQDSNLNLPHSLIADFNEVGSNLARVLSAFQESEKRFQDFISVSSDSVWETDEEDRYIFLSRDATSTNKLDLNQILGKRRWEVSGVDQDYGDWQHHRQTLAEQLPFRNFVFRRMDPGGHMLYWSASGKPRYNNAGEFKGYRGTSSDITAEIEAQKEAGKIQDQLRQSQKLEVVGQLTGGVAHDFNNLLSIVLGNLELIQEKKLLKGQAEKNLSDAIKGAQKGAALTHQLLAYSRQQTLKPIAVQPSSIIRDMQSMLERTLGEVISVRTNLNDGWSVLIDPAELENALLNLAVNARDAMPGGGELLIECFDTHLDFEYTETVPELKAGDYVCIVVNDSGEGIEEEIRDRIMEPFFTTKEVGKGSGLGLSMVFGFVKQSGGHITIYSEIGKGTSIQLYLPRAIKSKSAERTEETPTLIEGAGEHVLVVEDNPQVRQLIVTQLKSIGYRTFECEDGATALAILETGHADILLSDVTLPLGMNGVEIVNAVRELYPDMVALLMSGFTGSAIRSKDDLPEGVEILYKPFTKIRLSEALSRALKKE